MSTQFVIYKTGLNIEDVEYDLDEGLFEPLNYYYYLNCDDDAIIIFWPLESTQGVILSINEDHDLTIQIPSYASLEDIKVAFLLLRYYKKKYPKRKIYENGQVFNLEENSEEGIWQEMFEEYFLDSIQNDIYTVVDGNIYPYRISKHFLKEKYPQADDYQLAKCAVEDFKCVCWQNMDLVIFDSMYEEGSGNTIMVSSEAGQGTMGEYVRLLLGYKSKKVESEKYVEQMKLRNAITFLDPLTFKTEKISTSEWECIYNSLKGEERREIKTYLLRWKPSISDFSKKDYRQLISCQHPHIRWCINQYKDVKEDDHCYMLCSGEEGKEGIIFSGVFCYTPILGTDWKGSDKPAYYMEVSIDRPRALSQEPWISIEQLEKELPDIDWHEGHSCQLLTENQEAILDRLYHKSQQKYSSTDHNTFNTQV